MPTHDNPRKIIRGRVEYWAQRLSVQPRLVRVQRMTRKWGSCSTSGIVTLAADLADQDSDFQNFVIVHELLHAPARSQPWQALQGIDDGSHTRLEAARPKKMSRLTRSFAATAPDRRRNGSGSHGPPVNSPPLAPDVSLTLYLPLDDSCTPGTTVSSAPRPEPGRVSSCVYSPALARPSPVGADPGGFLGDLHGGVPADGLFVDVGALPGPWGMVRYPSRYSMGSVRTWL